MIKDDLGRKDGKPVYTQGAAVKGSNVIPFSPAQNTNIVYIPFVTLHAIWQK
jgi:hypothetical protein